MKIIIGLLIFGVLVAIHELGHFLLAKKNGITVNEFSIGMGPRIATFVRGGTRYSLKLFPIGGSCAMGEDEVAGSEDKNAFNNKSVWARISVIVAGPLFNFFLALVFAMIVIGIVGYDPALCLSVTPNSPAEQAGLKPGDLITEVNGKNISIGREVDVYFQFNRLDDKELSLEVEREGKKLELAFTPKYEKRYYSGFYFSSSRPDDPAEIIEIMEGYPIADTDLKVGDIITAIDGTILPTAEDLVSYLSSHPLTDTPITINYLHEGIESVVTVSPKFAEEGYVLGFNYNYNGRVKTNVLGVLKYSVVEVKYLISTTIKSLGQLITGKTSVNQLLGPVRIVSEIGKVVESSKQDGLLYIILNLLNWGIILSANLGVMNLLPLPALDGGRLMFLVIEAVRRKPINKEKEGMVHLVGIILLMLLMVFVFFNDIRNVFFS